MNYCFIDKFTPSDFVNPDQNVIFNQNIKSENNDAKGYHFNRVNQDKNNWATEGSISKSILGNLMAPTPVSELFLSIENINRLQNMIIERIFIETNGKYLLKQKQNESDLIIVMRNVLLSDAINSPYKIVHQVKILNHKVLKRVIPDMITAIKQDDAYIKQLDQPIDPIALPVNVNSKGRKQLPSVTTLF
jgi:hypothetical protein